jgi:2,4-diketo-3-deoxy-L-fuconate hydrolase
MRLANSNGRACLLNGDRLRDLEQRSEGRFSADPMAAIARFAELADWAAGLDPAGGDSPLDVDALGPCVPRPQKVFGIGLNYRDHAAEADLPIPQQPLVFTKFPSCLVGPTADVALTSDRVDWEVELVVVIGRGGARIAEADALASVAGYCVGQDISDRRLQFAGKPPQFSLGKSADSFGPIGPAVVSLDEIADPNDLRLDCTVAGEPMQDGRTSDMVFSVAELVAYLSRHCTLVPGDLIFTGTPAGVGSIRRRYLAEGELIESRVEGVGELRNRCVCA